MFAMCQGPTRFMLADVAFWNRQARAVSFWLNKQLRKPNRLRDITAEG